MLFIPGSVQLSVCHFYWTFQRSSFVNFSITYLFSLLLISALTSIISFLLWIMKPRWLISDLFSIRYKFFYRHCLSCIPEILIYCIFLVIQLKISTHFPVISSLIHKLFVSLLFNFLWFGVMMAITNWPKKLKLPLPFDLVLDNFKPYCLPGWFPPATSW